ncbi:hypothetical protein ASC77_00025 [Nocardioides sp. Root1257]|uniref:Ig-like domain-containing protein n=1 Tax=unclassified Nocardioides TaxID=2615069 RepID=UPI0006F5C99C|nr:MULTISPECIES: Ig-like domain-containing protein [unclassified Nocardioides]KQW52750.1 hypothetical protein ASC77_00025 [Nocardioides sp. Root1257]KRC55438.1 hypothetical protein ASE24_00025 [Nocardioides sp. Root224]
MPARPRVGARRPRLVALGLLLVAALVVAALGTAEAATAPTLANVRVSTLGTTSVTIAWDTDVASDTQVAYGVTAAYGSQSTLVTTKVTAHSATLTGLSANRTYHFQVRSRDAAGDLTASTDRTFTTKLGAAAAGGSTDSDDSNNINATRFTSVEGGRVVSLAVNVGAVDPSLAQRSFELAIYAANGNAPGALIARSARGSLVANSWNSVAIDATLAPSTAYYFAYNTNGASAAVNNLRYASGGSSGWRTNGQAFGTWPATFGSFTSQATTFSFQATFASDVTPPVVTLTQPADGATATGVVDLAATATDDSGIAWVQFKVGGVDLGPADTTPPFTASWDTRPLLDGPRTITAVATDTAGLSTTSSGVAVAVHNPARVRLTAPAPGEAVAGTDVTVRYAKAGDWKPDDGQHVHLSLDGGPTKMDFDVDGDQSYTFPGVPGGPHTVTAVVANASHVEQPDSGGSVSFTSTAADTVAPTVALTAPAPGATVGNTVTVSANASDDVGVVGVQFLLDGAPLGSEDTTAPYAVSWDTLTATNGAHTLRARARDTVNQTTSSAVDVTVTNSDPRAVVGEWSPLTSWPLVSVHATLMKTGEILMWDAWELPTAQAKVWNPTTNTFTDVPVGAGVFCSGQATDANGNVIVVGGHDGQGHGIKDVYSFNPDTRAWTKKPDMTYSRWYPSLTQMPDGKMLILSGASNISTSWVNTPEVYNPATSTVGTLPISTPEMHEEQYPQTNVLPDGKILAISAEHGSVMTFDPATNAWTRLGTTQVPFGAWTSFAPGKYLVTGGAATLDSYNPNNPVPSTRAAKVLDMTSGSPVWSDAGQMAVARSFHNLTMLPTGEAMAIGGSTVVNDYSSTGTKTAEIWSPATNTWRSVASPAAVRMYHSISMLLPDGRVLSSGGGRLAPAPDQLNMQMYSPGYLFKGPRPTISSLPGQIEYGATMDLVTPQAADIAKVSLVSLASVTHTADWNQHFLDLPFQRTGGTLTVSTPASANLAPPNYYMVFAVDSNGVPSMARIVKLGAGAAPGDTTPPTVSVTAPASGATLTGSATLTATAADNVGVAGVRFQVDGADVGSEDTTSPYSLTWASTTVGNGAHTVTAIARDTAGNTTTSTAVPVTVSNSAPSTLVAAYGLNEGTGTTFADASGSGNGGSVFQATWTAGKYGTALSFDGTNDYASVPDAPSLDLSSPMTLEAWVRPTASSGWRTILMKETPNDLAYSLYATSGTNRPSAWIGGGSSIGTAALPLNTWSHVASTYDGSRLRLYVNGTLVTNAAYAGAVPTSASPLKLGGNAVWGEFFAGQLDEVRIFSAARTQAQIQADMNGPI